MYENYKRIPKTCFYESRRMFGTEFAGDLEYRSDAQILFGDYYFNEIIEEEKHGGYLAGQRISAAKICTDKGEDTLTGV